MHFNPSNSSLKSPTYSHAHFSEYYKMPSTVKGRGPVIGRAIAKKTKMSDLLREMLPSKELKQLGYQSMSRVRIINSRSRHFKTWRQI